MLYREFPSFEGVSQIHESFSSFYLNIKLHFFPPKKHPQLNLPKTPWDGFDWRILRTAVTLAFWFALHKELLTNPGPTEAAEATVSDSGWVQVVGEGYGSLNGQI